MRSVIALSLVGSTVALPFGIDSLFGREPAAVPDPRFRPFSRRPFATGSGTGFLTGTGSPFPTGTGATGFPGPTATNDIYSILPVFPTPTTLEIDYSLAPTLPVESATKVPVVEDEPTEVIDSPEPSSTPTDPLATFESPPFRPTDKDRPSPTGTRTRRPPFPTGGFPTGVFPTGVFPTGVFPTGVFATGTGFPSGGFPFPTGTGFATFIRRPQPTGMPDVPVRREEEEEQGKSYWEQFKEWLQGGQ